MKERHYHDATYPYVMGQRIDGKPGGLFEIRFICTRCGYLSEPEMHDKPTFETKPCPACRCDTCRGTGIGDGIASCHACGGSALKPPTKVAGDTLEVRLLRSEVERLTAAGERIAQLVKERDEARELADKERWRYQQEQGVWIETRDAIVRLTAELAECKRQLSKRRRSPWYDG